ncbi:glycosyltransferase [uncultured Desulfovibrio sp.]|uniref:glycosyltransferase n=1 Tax=uncultured Desulfovibrio sp. TaxID=167968 RepID=UPI00260C433C|nr:glycosyltransferase [uncultured Desulfovibrio sp.]
MHEPSTGASPQGPLCNVTIPVFNRPAATERAIRALAATSREVPFHITVVDNGSEPELVKKLLALRAERLIDNLFLLPRNMGVACAANVGWQLVSAPLYMKLDNDTAIVRKHWLRDLLALWSHGQPLSNLGGAFNREMLRKTPGSLQTPHGELGLCVGNLPGQAVLVPQAVSEKLGFWNEEYGLYGGEDGDYGLRMQAAGLPQYYYLGPEYFENIREDDDARETYAARGIDKRRLHRELVVRDNLCMGKLFMNKILYLSGLRSLAPLQRYVVDDVDGQGRVRLAERKEYKDFQRDLAQVAAGLNARFRDYVMSYKLDAPTADAMRQVLEKHAQATKIDKGL